MRLNDAKKNEANGFNWAATATAMATMGPQHFFPLTQLGLSFFGSPLNFSNGFTWNWNTKMRLKYTSKRSISIEYGKIPKNHHQAHSHTLHRQKCECKTQLKLQEDCAPKNLFGYWNLALLKYHSNGNAFEYISTAAINALVCACVRARVCMI